MKYILSILLCITVLVLTLSSCGDEPVIDTGYREGEQPVTITVGAVDTRSGTVLYSAADYDISTIRVMGYRSSDGTLAFNRLISNFTVTDTDEQIKWEATVNVLTGGFDFVFIANERLGSATSDILKDPSQVGTLTQLKKQSFPATAFSASQEIPMVTSVENVLVLGDNRIQIGSTTYNGVWQVVMERLAVRVELGIEMPAAFATGATLSFDNVPTEVYLFQKDNTANTGPVPISATPVQTTTTEGKKLAWTRVILPECWFFPVMDDDNAVEVCLTNGNDTKKGKIGLKVEGGENYTMPRNYYFDIEGKIEDSGVDMDITLSVQPWTEIPVNGPAGHVELRVSAVTASINERNMARIYFSSNQKEISIYNQTATNEQVDDLFYGLVGTNPKNFTYDYNGATGEGTGYFDIMTDHEKNIQSQKYKIYVCAGKFIEEVNNFQNEYPALMREITVDVDLQGESLDNYKNYIGAFWRNNQKGERVIAMPNQGSWTATVDYTGVEAPGGWVVLAEGKSLDPDFWTDQPGDPEAFPVEGNATTITGSGDIYFRIGLNSPNTHFDLETGGIKPRYAQVKITSSSNNFALFLRQGEEPDYIMRPTDIIEGGSWDSSTRPLANRFSAFNLTSPDYLGNVPSKTGGTTLAGHSILPVRGGAFVEYPTQGGAFFKWADLTDNYAYHPSNPNLYGTITGYGTSASMSGFWDTWRQTRENCPPGYRRPQDGDTDKAIPAGNFPPVQESETRQSLWLNPLTGRGGNLNNMTSGYYADGFFDRRPIVDGMGRTVNSNVAVSTNDSRVAYFGFIFFNPGTLASVFLPAASHRNESSGGLGSSGFDGVYMLASRQSGADQIGVIQLHPAQSIINNVLRANYAGSVRCVVDDPFSKLIWTIEDRVLADEDALLNGTTGAAQMNWAQAMGINTSYNTSEFYSSGYSTGVMDNLGYTNGTAVAAIPATGCAAYWQEDENDAVSGIGQWFVPGEYELRELYESGRFNLGPDPSQGSLQGYWSSREDSYETASLIVPNTSSQSAAAMQRKLATGRVNHTRCVRYPTAKELEWRLANK